MQKYFYVICLLTILLISEVAIPATTLAFEKLPEIKYAQTTYAKAAGILTACRIIDRANAITPDNPLTRQDMALLFGKTVTEWRFKPEEYVSSLNLTDLPADLATRGYIAYCVDNGIMPAKTPATFAPDEPVFLREYCNTLMNVLKLPNSDSVSEAANLNLFQNLDLSGNNPITREIAHIILQRALFTPSRGLSVIGGTATTLAAQNFYTPYLPDLFDVVYVPGSNEPKHRLDVYYPTSNPPCEGWPVLIIAHGGGFSRDDKFGHPASMPLMGALKEGFAVVCISYRLTNTAAMPAQILDAKAAVRFLRANAEELNLDTEKFVFSGLSAGGYLAALIATSADHPYFDNGLKALDSVQVSDKVAAAVILYGVCDYRTTYRQTLWLAGAEDKEYDVKYANYKTVRAAFAATQNLADYADWDPDWKYALFDNKSVKEAAELVKAVTAATYADKTDCPTLLLHGTADRSVPFLQAVDFCESMQAASAPVEMVLVPNAEHGRDFTNVYDIKCMFQWIKNSVKVQI